MQQVYKISPETFLITQHNPADSHNVTSSLFIGICYNGCFCNWPYLFTLRLTPKSRIRCKRQACVMIILFTQLHPCPQLPEKVNIPSKTCTTWTDDPSSLASPVVNLSGTLCKEQPPWCTSGRIQKTRFFLLSELCRAGCVKACCHGWPLHG